MTSNIDYGISSADASFLFNDLNDIVNMRLEEVMTPYLKNHIVDTTTPFDTSIFPQLGTLPDESFNIPILNQFNLSRPHSYYLSMFYHSFSTLMSPLKPNPSLNPVRDILLKYALKENYLLFCVLACGAKSALRESSKIQDSEAYYSYLSTGLSKLKEYSSDEKKIAEKIESMLLTLLLLIGDCASSKYLKWREHLDGAKQLLKKTKLKSDTINFCRNWFTLYEILAGITNNKGGSFSSSDGVELNFFINNDSKYLESLRRLDMIDDKHFNFVSGHIIELDIVYREIIKILNNIRSLRKQGIVKKNESHLNYTVVPSVVSLKEIHRLISMIEDLQEKIIIDKSIYISPNHPLHNFRPNNPDKSSSIDTRTLKTGQTITLSLFDISHQTHTIGAKLVLLTSIMELPKTSILVQETVKQGLSYIRFLEELDGFDNICISHLHFPMSQIGKHCIESRDQALVEKFMKIAHGMGLYSANHNLDKLKKIWKNEDIDEDDEQDFLTW